MLCQIYTHDTEGAQHLRVSVYISGKARVPMLLLIIICYTSGTLKICLNLKLTVQRAYIVTAADCNCGRYLHVSLMFPNLFYDVRYLV